MQEQTHSEATMRTYEYLNDEAVAKLFGVAVSTVKRWRLEGRLGFTRIGPRRVGIRREDVDAFIKSGEQPAKAA
jgi:excisionase family DNA binding protein